MSTKPRFATAERKREDHAMELALHLTQPFTRNDIAEHTNWTRSTLEKVLVNLVHEGRLTIAKRPGHNSEYCVVTA